MLDVFSIIIIKLYSCSSKKLATISIICIKMPTTNLKSSTNSWYDKYCIKNSPTGMSLVTLEETERLALTYGCFTIALHALCMHHSVHPMKLAIACDFFTFFGGIKINSLGMLKNCKVCQTMQRVAYDFGACNKLHRLTRLLHNCSWQIIIFLDLFCYC